ncbi:hypothetical protein BDV36DRAFT_290502 [Aspergillus pseudocaelatus]|uniref:Gamma-glutamylcyclotransferase AIG2-like domain-containing protein n=1 Tax=Aspergillus pseudocaelatus TaxID=1825620 RepID=A0ABQ6X405_9EURO|nr:hypothetical protein BDV36DRAFT_290502 [Aspergillus pseudocaelatus]
MSHKPENHTKQQLPSLFPAKESPTSPFYTMLQSAPPDYLLQREQPHEHEYPPSYPIYYFSYGTLTHPPQLKHILDLLEEPNLRKPELIGYDIAKWGGDYTALINGKQDQVVSGYAYLVKSEEEAEKLAEYETRAYRVASCWIFFRDGAEEPKEVGGKVFIKVIS